MATMVFLRDERRTTNVYRLAPRDHWSRSRGLGLTGFAERLYDGGVGQRFTIEDAAAQRRRGTSMTVRGGVDIAIAITGLVLSGLPIGGA